jgi:hypothetical protein
VLHNQPPLLSTILPTSPSPNLLKSHSQSIWRTPTEWYVTLQHKDSPSNTIRFFIYTGSNGTEAIATVVSLPTVEETFEMQRSDSERGAFRKMVRQIKDRYPKYIWIIPADD